jgi:hypothetical protein
MLRGPLAQGYASVLKLIRSIQSLDGTSQKFVKTYLFCSTGFGFLGDQERIREIAWQ